MAQELDGEGNNYKITYIGPHEVDLEEKDNQFIEMGARVLNGTFELKMVYQHVMTRLYVTTTEQLPTDQALTLQNNTLTAQYYSDYGETYPATEPTSSDPGYEAFMTKKNASEKKVEMYKQLGSCALNPFHRLGDALEYIINVRKNTTTMYDETRSIADYYKDIRFEVFLSDGTFYPFRDAHGKQGEARANTFVVPEEVSIIGGVDFDGHPYCQETSGTMTVAGLELMPATTSDIRSTREHMDRNGNHVEEPWEMRKQTILSGNAVNVSSGTNVYHVITCLADREQVGELPTRSPKNGTTPLDPVLPLEKATSTGARLRSIEAESSESRDKRAIILDGLTITGGYANKIEENDNIDNFQTLTYFRGGGIFIDGNWDNTFNTSTDLPEVLSVARRDIVMITADCLFQDNLAGNGGGVYTNGTFYSFSCHYTKNTAMGPETDIDRRYIPWSAGDAIANNYNVHLWNCLFDNNESKHSKYDIIDGDAVMRREGDKDIKNPIYGAEARHGYAGVVSCSETGLVRMSNCHVVRNKAVAFPAIYNFIDNNLRAYASTLADQAADKIAEIDQLNDDIAAMDESAAKEAKIAERDAAEEDLEDHIYTDEGKDRGYYGAGHHFAVNTILWGNVATGSTIALSTPIEDRYYDGIYGDGWEETQDYRQPNHVANFAPHLDIATLTFCAYQEETGRPGTVWESNQNNARQADIKNDYDPVTGEMTRDGLTRLYAGDFMSTLDEYFGYYPGTPDGDAYPYGHPETPFCKKVDGKYVPSALTDVENLIWLNTHLENEAEREVKVYGTGGYLDQHGHPYTKEDITSAAITAAVTDGTYTQEEAASLTDDQKDVLFLTYVMGLLNAVPYNYNLTLSKDNNATGGPYFVQPSITAGAEGYMETADWLVGRLNNIIDTGWGFLKQNVKQQSEESGIFDTKLLEIAQSYNSETEEFTSVQDDEGNDILIPSGYKLVINNYSENVGDADYGKPWMYYERFYLDTTSVGPPVVTTGEVDYTRLGKVYLLIPIGTELETTTIEGKVRPVFESEWLGRYKGEDDNKHSWRKRVPSTTTLANDPYSELCQYTQLYGTGFYNLHAKNIHLRFEQYGYPNLLPIGDDIYMEYVHDGEGAATNMRRISTHPKMGVQDVFIDMGIYEYQYVQLVTSGKETDVIWVAEEEDETYRPCDGSTWQKATSDLQGAIETLLLSRNDHDKVIKIRGGLYSPTRITQNNEKAFFISVPSKNDGVTLPKELDADVTHMVKSLTIRGGYTNTLLDNVSDGELSRDPENPSNKVTFEMVNLGNKDEQLEHLFVIEDAEQKGTYVNYLTNDNKDYKNYVIPIVLDGITFYNPHSHGNGAALYYKEQFKTAEDGESSTTDLLEPKSYTISETRHDLPKLIVKNCTFVGNGANKDVSAVKIEKGGGHTLFVNCVFHSNQGTPLDAVNTKVINCTSALNGGHIILTDEQEVYPKPEKWKEGDPIPSANYPSGIYNSIIWRDDQVNDERIPLTRQEFNGEYDGSEKIYDPKADMPMKYNAISYNENNPTKDEPDAADDLFIDNVTGVIVDNHLLSKENGSVLYGPNFVEPDNVSILERNFHLNPSARILNQGDVATYLALVPYYPEQRTQLEKITVKDIEDRSKDEISYFHSVQRHDVPEQVTYKVGDVDNYVTYNPMTLQEANLRGTQTSTGFDALLTDATHYPFTWGIEGVDEKLPSELVSTRENNRFTAFDFTERESAFKARLYGSGLERGAYECTATIQRVVYVADGVEGEEDGTSWSDAYDIDDLQKAVDVASIYSLTSTTPSRAYVFVKESEFENNALKVRDGVSVFGSISTSLLAEVVKVGNEHTDREIEIFINRVRANRGGIAAKTTTPNIIKGLVSDNSVTFTNGFLLDGFRIEGADKTIDMTKTNTVIRNSVITDNEIAKDGDPVVNVGNGLLYNTLIYGNTPGSGASMVNVGANGYVLNTSIVGTSTVSVDDGVTKAAHVKNTIEATANDNMFAQYMRPVGGREPRPLYLTNHEPYWYQLHEESNQIDAGTVQSESDVMSMLPEGLRSYVDFTLDRDVLGNPRMINSSVDNGCFETWRVSSNRYATNETDKDARPDPGEVVLDPTADGYDADAAAAYYAGSDYVAYSNSYKSNYGGHRYPHPGSVVYVMDGGALSVNKDNFTGSNAIRPGYVLVKKGGSIYGQGNNLQFQYVAAEKVYSDQQYDMVSLPFIYNPADAIEVQSHNAETDELPFTWAPAFTKYTYDATKRAEHNYQFKENDSEAWKEMADGIVPASDGWLLKFNSPIDDTPKTIRFTGWVTDAQLGSGQYAYSEGGNSKIVNLTQYDNRVGGTGTTLNFTRQEDMGWNLKGIPYLITNYPTYPVTSEVYNMQIPRVFYKMGGDGEYVKKSEAIYTAESWESPAAISFGEGFFTQTAVISKVEDLVFRAIDAPVGALAAAPARPIVLMRDQDGEGDIIRVKPDEQAPENFSFSLGRDGIKWMMSDAPYLYLLSSSNSRLSLLGAAPVGVDIPLGVSVPKDARYEDQPHYFIFSLPEPEAFEDYSHVWLIDRTFNHITNLMEGNYTTTIDAGTDNSRFILRIGGFPYENMYGHREYIVYSWHRDLHIRGLVEGDIIQVFSLSGQMVLNTTARDPEFTAQLPQAGGIYIVRVNDFSTKVRNL
ncbi:MAG: hypothetical protein IKO63_05460 [Paludibacteraceae bacterium]|nr:hypothetical protein [Paludibacteraceae bacterium]